MDEFLGYLPPYIDGSLISLMNDAAPRNGTVQSEDQPGIDFRRSLSLTVLHRYFEREGHRAAVRLIADAWGGGRTFGLYLRNFDLGARYGGRTPSSEHVTTFSTADARLQRVLAETELSLVGIENPILDFAGRSYIPKLSLAPERWVEVAQLLIPAARVIVVYFAALSPGLGIELDLIRSHAKEAATVVVIDRSAGGAVARELEARSNVARLVPWDGTPISADRLRAALGEVCRADAGCRFGSLPSLDVVRALPAELRRKAERIALQAMGEANEHARRGEVYACENALVRCIALCCFAESDEGRAAAHVELARAQHHRGERSYAQGNYARALSTCRRASSAHLTAIREAITADLRTLEEDWPGFVQAVEAGMVS